MITKRDWQVMDFLKDYKAAYTSTLVKLFYPSQQSACRRLAEMVKAGAIKRERGNVSLQYAYYIKKPAQLRHALALTTFYADFASRYEVRHFAREPTIGSIRPDALIGYIEDGKDALAFVEVELSNKGLDYKKYMAFEQNECKQFFGKMPKIIVVTDKNWKSCEKYEVWRI